MTHTTKSESQILYHYTDSFALLEILTKGEIWATHIGQMNDRSEGRYVREIAKNILEDLAKQSLHSDERVALSEIAELVGDTRFLQRRYVFSLCEDGDSLSLWRAYASNGGYSIGISLEKIMKFCSENGWDLKQCVYDEHMQREEITNRINSVIEGKGALAGLIYESVASEIDSEIRELEAYYKHPSFFEEREWRVIYSPNSDNIDDHGGWKTRGATIVNYQKLECGKLLKNDLTESSLQVTFSPGEYTFDRQQTLFWMLLHNGYANPNICRSNAPFAV